MDFGISTLNSVAIANSALGGNIVAVTIQGLARNAAKYASFALNYGIAGLANNISTYQPPSVMLGTIPISVKKQEAYAYRADVTQHAMEAGAVLIDHVILQPMRIDISFEIANWEAASPAQANDLFVKLFNERTLLDLETAHTILRDMVLVNYQAENVTPNWGALDCRASFVQVKYVSLEAVKFPAEKVTTTDNTGGPDVSKSAESETSVSTLTPQEESGLR